MIWSKERTSLRGGSFWTLSDSTLETLSVLMSSIILFELVLPLVVEGSFSFAAFMFQLKVFAVMSGETRIYDCIYRIEIGRSVLWLKLFGLI